MKTPLLGGKGLKWVPQLDFNQLVIDGIDDRIEGLTAGNATQNIFSTFDTGTNTYVRNTSFWAYDVANLVCLPIGVNGGCPVTPMDVLYAKHYPPSGTQRWVTADNQVIERTITGYTEVFEEPLGTSYHQYDVALAHLNEPLPDSIGFSRVYPPTYERWFPPTNHGVISTSLQAIESLPLFWRGNDNKGYVMRGDSSTQSSPALGESLIFGHANQYSQWMGSEGYASYPQREAFSKLVAGGDSGSPCGTIINNEFILRFCMWDYGQSPNISNEFWIEQINLKLNALGRELTFWRP